MDGRRPFTNIPPHELDGATESTVSDICANRPKFPFYDDRRLQPVLTASGGDDRMSYLPIKIQYKILSRLSIKEAARTAVLSSRWRKIWLSNPLVRIDQIPKPSPPFTNIDPETEADLRRHGMDPHEVDIAAEHLQSIIYANLPEFPVYDDRRLPPLLATSDGVDRMSRLPHEVRCQIVSRLPVKDAARTATLSSRWRKIWLSTPLVLIDAHLLPKRQSFRPTPADSPAITANVSNILEAHPGPFRCVHLVCSHMNKYRPQLTSWLQLLATKGVQELVLVNRPWPLDVPLPCTIFSITTLTRLYIGRWKLPDMSVLRGVVFHHLRELGIYHVFMKRGDVESIISRSPVLEILNIMGGVGELHLRLISQSLRCIQIWPSKMYDIAVVKAPCLERLVLYDVFKRGRLNISHAPKLHAIGFLEPGQLLQIGGTVIMPGIKVSIRSMVSSVKILGLNVCFGVRDDVKIVPTLLRCFPNVERLHIQSGKSDKRSGYLKLNFWKKSGPIENVVHCIKEMIITEFRGEASALNFLDFFFRSARVLENAAIVLPNPQFTPVSKDLISKLWKIAQNSGTKAKVSVFGSNCPDGGELWNFQTGADMSSRDPFSVI